MQKRQSRKYILLKFLLSSLGLCFKSCAYSCAYVDACVARFIAFHCFAFCLMLMFMSQVWTRLNRCREHVKAVDVLEYCFLFAVNIDIPSGLFHIGENYWHTTITIQRKHALTWYPPYPSGWALEVLTTKSYNLHLWVLEQRLTFSHDSVVYYSDIMQTE